MFWPLLAVLAVVPEVNGVYLAGGPYADVVELKGRSAVWYGPRGPTFESRLTQDEFLLRFDFSSYSLETTYAVIDGRLWLNVMRRQPGAAPGVWHAVARRAVSLWPQLVEGPAEVTWNEVTHEWTAYDVESRRPVTHVDGVVREQAPLTCGFTISSLSQNGTFEFEQQGDVVLTPWSVAMGPVGLVASTREARELVGVWGDGATTVHLVREVRPSFTLGWHPDPSVVAVHDGGRVFVETWGHGCGVNHFDVPAVSVYVARPTGQLVKMTRTSLHWQPGARLSDLVLTARPEAGVQ